MQRIVAVAIKTNVATISKFKYYFQTAAIFSNYVSKTTKCLLSNYSI